MASGAASVRLTLFTRRGSPLHEACCDAFLDWGGYVVLDDRLAELLFAEHVPQLDGFRWRARFIAHVGAA